MNNVIPKKPRFDLACRSAYQTLHYLKIHSFPFNILPILDKFNIMVATYGEVAKGSGKSIQDIIISTGTEDGLTIYAHGTYIVLYNETIQVSGRIRWTLAHELGHIVLKHFTDFDATQLTRGGLTDSEYKVLDREANTFASEFLCSPALVNVLPISNTNAISTILGISYEAAAYAKKKLQDYPLLHTRHSSFFRKQFYDFLNVKYCMNCQCRFVSKNAKFCPICGSENIQWGNFKQPTFIFFRDKETKKVPVMHYKNYPTTVTGHVKDQCIRCENEDLKEDFKFCPICGLSTTNKCVGVPDDWSDEDTPPQAPCELGQTLPPNARYCPYCGGYSDYYIRQALPSWKDEVKQIQEEETEGYNSLPTDEQIPF